MNIDLTIGIVISEAVNSLYGVKIPAQQIQVQKTKKEFEGDVTVVVFPFVKTAGKSPEETGKEIGSYLERNQPFISGYNVIKGFLNLVINKSFWIEELNCIHANERFGIKTPPADEKLMMIEYSSPNTNKPLHLGHIRNNLLGYSISEIQKANGWKVVKTNIVNDRGIHICKSMLAWQKWGNGETPESSGLKGDHLVGKYYVTFSNKLKQEVNSIYDKGLNKINIAKTETFSDTCKENLSIKIRDIDNQMALLKTTNRDMNIEEILDLCKNNKISEVFDILPEIYIESIIDNNKTWKSLWKFLKSKYNLDINNYIKKALEIENKIENLQSEINDIIEPLTNLMIETQKMLLAWENGDLEVRQLWEMMNSWVYAGFDETYKKLGVDFDKIYYESETYLEGKSTVEEGLAKGTFYRRDDGSVWADLTNDGLDEKLLLRADGTSVYMTQDIGTAKLRYNDYPIDRMVYVVGNEQNYHFQVLSILLDKLGFEWGKSLVHFSYGMVELPEGKMKSREGTVVDADDLVDEMVNSAREIAKELGKVDENDKDALERTATMVGLGALKYFILKVDPKKNMTFNPKESIDFNGNTGPFIQYTHARICSVLSKAKEQGIEFNTDIDKTIAISDKESNLIQLISNFENTVHQAGEEFSPALIANYIYDLVKEYNQFYHDFSILREENTELKRFRLKLSDSVAKVVKTGMRLLGIEVPERM